MGLRWNGKHWEVRGDQDSSGEVSLFTREDLRKAASALDDFQHLGKTSSFIRSDGVLVNFYKGPRTGKIVMHREEGNYATFTNEAAEKLKLQLWEELK